MTKKVISFQFFKASILMAMTKKVVTFGGKKWWQHQLPHRMTPTLVTPMLNAIDQWSMIID